jgi:hypothetical protein
MIKTVHKERISTERDANRRGDTFLNRSHYRASLKGDLVVRDRYTNALVLAATRQVVPKDVREAAHDVWQEIKKQPNNRGTAVAGPGAMMNGITQAGELSPQLRVPPEVMAAAGNPRSDQIGFFDGDRCGGTELTLSKPEMYGNAARAFIEAVAQAFEEFFPEEHAIQMEEVAKIPAHLVIPNTPFSTVTLNRNWRTTAHRDKGDLLRGTSILTCTRADNDGELILPEYGLAVFLKPGDVVFMNAHLLHGNGPFEGERMTQVLYAREKMHLCSAM